MPLTDDPSRRIVRDLVSGIHAGDAIEQQAKDFAMDWIGSGAPLFRTQRPAIPDPHLCVNAVMLDSGAGKLLLTDHVNAERWLPAGGHVEDQEDPRDAVLREAREELGIDPAFHPRHPDGAPVFLTVTQTWGRHIHTDVTLWILLDGREHMPLVRDPREARELRWFAVDDPDEWAHPDRFDPAMCRFLGKLATHVDLPAAGVLR
ncbi:NUDIX domain-containing protein [Nocardia sp. BMG51109]|uniref:NUDIX domain-containing protein n=1 Tax=Nocardia sp. BMG51109 TaxID=1056816 RepID=UPI000467CC56|nr:NUDIX domain-containing protein [Nocardia sp. BMG51109]